MGWRARHELVEPGFEAGGIGFQSGVRELVSSPSDPAGAAEQMPEIGREDVVAGVDGVLHVTNEMSETNLVFRFRSAHLAAITVRDPEIGPKRAEEPLDHLFAARRLDGEHGAVVMVEPPQPAVPFADPEAGLVGLQDGSRHETGADVARLAREGVTGGIHHVDEGAFADFEAEDFEQKPRQVSEGDALRKAQVDDEGTKVFPEWRAGLHSAGRRGFELFRATRTDPATQRYACDIGLDVRDFDAIIDFAGSLRQAGNVRAAMLARGRHQVALVRRVRMQWLVRPRMRLARRHGYVGKA